jgi:hypothetical protein
MRNLREIFQFPSAISASVVFLITDVILLNPVFFMSEPDLA